MNESGTNEESGHVEEAFRRLRVGDLDGASGSIARLRSIAHIDQSPTLASKVFLVEGCVHAYRTSWSEARDRLTRARLIADARGQADVLALSLAWLSYVDFAESRFESCVELAVKALKTEPRGSFCGLRASTVLGILFEMAQDPERASKYFAYARKCAGELNESGATSTIIFNILATKVSVEQFNREVLGNASMEDGLALLFSESSRNFDALGGVRVMSSMHGLLRGQICNLAGDHEQAAAVLASTLEAPVGLSVHTKRQAVCELAWASSHLASSDGRLAKLQELEREASQFIDDDDRSVALARLVRAYVELGEQERAASIRERCAVAATSVVTWRSEILSLLLNRADPADLLLPSAPSTD